MTSSAFQEGGFQRQVEASTHAENETASSQEENTLKEKPSLNVRTARSTNKYIITKKTWPTV